MGEGVPFTDEVWGRSIWSYQGILYGSGCAGMVFVHTRISYGPGSGAGKNPYQSFGGVDKVLMVAEPSDGEEDFFCL